MTSDEIKAKYSMKDIVGRYGIKINRSGKCCCPFHQEKTASMKVYSDHFNCFGCGVHGDIFEFIQLMEDCDFKDAYFSLGGTYEKNEDQFKQRMVEYNYEQKRKEREKAEMFEHDFKAELLSVWKMSVAEIGRQKALTDNWCYLVNALPSILGVWEEKYMYGRDVNEINVLRKCSEIRQAISSMS